MNVIDDSTIDFDDYLQGPDESANIRPASDWTEEVIARFANPPALRGRGLPWPKTHSLFRLRPQEVTLWHGFNGAGKSMLLSQVVKHLMAQGEKVCIASMEMRPAATMERMTRQATAFEKPSVKGVRDFAKWTDGRLWLYDQQGMVRADRLVAVMRYAHEKLGVRHFIIDSLLKCSIAEDDFNSQKAFVDQLCAQARDTDMHIHLVAHSRKLKDESNPPGKYDIRGSGSISDQVDNVIAVFQNKKKAEDIASGKASQSTYEQFDCLMVVQKHRHGEWEGKVQLWFDKGSLNYLESPTCHPYPLNTEPLEDEVEF